VKRFLFLAFPVTILMILAAGVLAAGCGGGGTTTTSSVTVGSTISGGGTATPSTVSSESSATQPSSTTSSSAGAGGLTTQITINLTGRDEVPPNDSQATGVFTLSIVMGGAGGTTGSSAAAGGAGDFTINYKLEVTNITDATAAHIHLGAKGQNGPVIVPLFTGPPKAGSFTGVLAEGTLTEKDLTGPMAGKSFTDLAGAVLAGQTYVNVHTTKLANGEIRGQIMLPTGATGGGSTTSIVTTASTGIVTTSSGSY
jgi:hypothetical protein